MNSAHVIDKYGAKMYRSYFGIHVYLCLLKNRIKYSIDWWCYSAFEFRVNIRHQVKRSILPDTDFRMSWATALRMVSICAIIISTRSLKRLASIGFNLVNIYQYSLYILFIHVYAKVWTVPFGTLFIYSVCVPFMLSYMWLLKYEWYTHTTDK